MDRNLFTSFNQLLRGNTVVFVFIAGFRLLVFDEPIVVASIRVPTKESWAIQRIFQGLQEPRRH